MIMKRAVLLAAVIALSGCAGGAPVTAPSVTSAPLYQLGAGDRLRIDVYNEPKLSGEFVVDGDGKVAMPLAGRITASDLTVAQFSDALTQALADGIMLHPSVTVQVLGYRPVFVLGEVARPGQYPYSEKMTFYSLVAQAGGFTYRASKRAVALRRDGETEERKIQIDSATAVRPGDTVRILERIF